MKKIPVSMILCALMSATSVFAQTSETFNGTVRETTPESYRADNPYTKEWEMIKEEGVAWKKRVWRTIDLSDKANAMLNESATHASVGELLMNGLYTRAFRTYQTTDDRLTTELTPDDIETLKLLRGQKINSLQIKEDWIMFKKDSKMVVRIVGMAPVIGSEGKPAFWVYYPDARNYFAQQPIASANNGPANFDEVFEGRFFSSKIDKTSEAMAPPAKDPSKKW